VIQNPGFLPDHAQNGITCSLWHARHTLKISERSVHNFSSYLANRQTNKQTNKNRQKHYLLGGGNYMYNATVQWTVAYLCTQSTDIDSLANENKNDVHECISEFRQLVTKSDFKSCNFLQNNILQACNKCSSNIS